MSNCNTKTTLIVSAESVTIEPASGRLVVKGLSIEAGSDIEGADAYIDAIIDLAETVAKSISLAGNSISESASEVTAREPDAHEMKLAYQSGFTDGMKHVNRGQYSPESGDKLYREYLRGRTEGDKVSQEYMAGMRDRYDGKQQSRADYAYVVGYNDASIELGDTSGGKQVYPDAGSNPVIGS